MGRFMSVNRKGLTGSNYKGTWESGGKILNRDTMMHRETPGVADLSASLRHLVIRPRRRMLAAQLIVGLCIFEAMILWIRMAEHGSPLMTRLIAFAFVVSLGIHLIRFCRYAPRAIVATDEFLGITSHRGRQQRIQWPSIVLATYSTKLLGMQWELDLTGSERIILRDIGIDSRRWGLLRGVIVELAARNGAGVKVDSLSESIYT